MGVGRWIWNRYEYTFMLETLLTVSMPPPHSTSAQKYFQLAATSSQKCKSENVEMNFCMSKISNKQAKVFPIFTNCKYITTNNMEWAHQIEKSMNVYFAESIIYLPICVCVCVRLCLHLHTNIINSYILNTHNTYVMP